MQCDTLIMKYWSTNVHQHPIALSQLPMIFPDVALAIFQKTSDLILLTFLHVACESCRGTSILPLSSQAPRMWLRCIDTDEKAISEALITSQLSGSQPCEGCLLLRRRIQVIHLIFYLSASCFVRHLGACLILAMNSVLAWQISIMFQVVLAMTHVVCGSWRSHQLCFMEMFSLTLTESMKSRVYFAEIGKLRINDI